MSQQKKNLASAGDYALLCERRISLDLLNERGCRLATVLADGGIRQDSTVAILMRNDFCYLEASIATNLLGAYAIPINWHQKGEEIGFILRDASVSALLVHADLLPQLEGHIPPEVRVIAAPTAEELAIEYGIPDAARRVPAGAENYHDLIERAAPYQDKSKSGTRGTIIYTSGTTGRPKGVRRLPVGPEEAAVYSKLAEDWWGLCPDVRTVMAGPMYHSAPNTYTKAVLRTGGTIVLMPRFDAEELLQNIERERITHIHLVPTMFIRLLQLPAETRARYDTSSLKFVVHGAAPCPPEIKRSMIEWWGPVIYEYYGATETGMVTRSDSLEWMQRPGTVGKPWSGRTVRIYTEDGRVAEPGEVGEVYSSLNGVPQFTYHNRDDDRRQVDRDGLVTNGDVGYLDEDGYLFLVDRKKDMVISGGVNIYPAEIESSLAMHPKVQDSAVIGVPDAEFGEKLAAFVIPQQGQTITDDELIGFLKMRLANFKVPRIFNFVSELPRDDSGKLMKRKLRDPYWTGQQRQI